MLIVKEPSLRSKSGNMAGWSFDIALLSSGSGRGRQHIDQPSCNQNLNQKTILSTAERLGLLVHHPNAWLSEFYSYYVHLYIGIMQGSSEDVKEWKQEILFASGKLTRKGMSFGTWQLAGSAHLGRARTAARSPLFHAASLKSCPRYFYGQLFTVAALALDAPSTSEDIQ